ncbi:MAG: hypothetical protein ABIP94_13715 [Planctomycetota bacterium]
MAASATAAATTLALAVDAYPSLAITRLSAILRVRVGVRVPTIGGATATVRGSRFVRRLRLLRSGVAGSGGENWIWRWDALGFGLVHGPRNDAHNDSAEQARSAHFPSRAAPA